MTVVSRFQRGFSLVEAVVVIVVTGIMLAAVAMFLRWPFQAYLDTARHGQLSDIADTALRRIARDLHLALPNSTRITGGGAVTGCMELLPTVTGGRYRAAVTAAGQGDILDFTQADGSFDMFGLFSPVPGQAPVAGQLVVVYNLGAASPGADAYHQNNTAIIANTGPGSPPNAATESKITFVTPTLFPLASPSNRFQVIGNTAVSYVCTPAGVDAQGYGTGILSRVSGYPIAANQTCPPVGGNSAVLANNISLCTMEYTPAGPTNVTAREGLVAMTLQVQQANEAATLYHEVHVNNAP